MPIDTPTWAWAEAAAKPAAASMTTMSLRIAPFLAFLPIRTHRTLAPSAKTPLGPERRRAFTVPYTSWARLQHLRRGPDAPRVLGASAVPRRAAAFASSGVLNNSVQACGGRRGAADDGCLGRRATRGLGRRATRGHGRRATRGGSAGNGRAPIVPARSTPEIGRAH